MTKGDIYICKDGNEIDIRTFVAEKKGFIYSKEKGFTGDNARFCRQLWSEFPIHITYKSCGQVIEFYDYDFQNDWYIYKYIVSEVNKGLLLPLTEQQLKKLYEYNNY